LNTIEFRNKTIHIKNINDLVRKQNKIIYYEYSDISSDELSSYL